MITARTVLPETLDTLAADDPAAQRSRRDLRRIHRVMGTRAILRRALLEALPDAAGRRPLRMLEIGAGDGTLLLGLARDTTQVLPAVMLTLLDRQELLSPETVAAYQRLGWSVRVQTTDIATWTNAGDAQADVAGTWDLIVANLFLHHFSDHALPGLLAAVARRCQCFVAVEPRRARLAWIASHLVGALGANAVTREDAVLSVRAGFHGAELGALWAQRPGWQIREYPAGLFSHVFQAVRLAPVAP
jgi:SAM-dependent methyltransferase